MWEWVTCQPARPFPVAASPLQHEIIIVILCDPEFKRVFQQYFVRLEPHSLEYGVWRYPFRSPLGMSGDIIYSYVCVLMFCGVLFVCSSSSLLAHVHIDMKPSDTDAAKDHGICSLF